MKSYKFIDLFAGLGGFRVAFESECKKRNLSSKCVYVAEINEKVIKTYRANHEHKENEKIGNIRDVPPEQVPKHDFLFAGFPCQTFSNAGKKLGFLDQVRGTLFYDIANILEIAKPKFALLENVKHLVNHDNGET